MLTDEQADRMIIYDFIFPAVVAVVITTVVLLIAGRLIAKYTPVHFALRAKPVFISISLLPILLVAGIFMFDISNANFDRIRWILLGSPPLGVLTAMICSRHYSRWFISLIVINLLLIPFNILICFVTFGFSEPMNT